MRYLYLQNTVSNCNGDFKLYTDYSNSLKWYPKICFRFRCRFFVVLKITIFLQCQLWLHYHSTIILLYHCRRVLLVSEIWDIWPLCPFSPLWWIFLNLQNLLKFSGTEVFLCMVHQHRNMSMCHVQRGSLPAFSWKELTLLIILHKTRFA